MHSECWPQRASPHIHHPRVYTENLSVQKFEACSKSCPFDIEALIISLSKNMVQV